MLHGERLLRSCSGLSKLGFSLVEEDLIESGPNYPSTSAIVLNTLVRPSNLSISAIMNGAVPSLV
jgi:hypothetical protein